MGSTCTGKTKLAIHLEKKFPLEIISVDSAMVYREMDIGTDKPPKNILDTIKHHLINIRNPNEDFNVADFFHDTNQLIRDIHSRNKVPLLVGGSLMYFNSLYEGLSTLPKKNTSGRNLIDSLLEVYTPHDLHNCLKKIDLKTYNKIQSNDKQRIQRALEVYMSSGNPISSLLKNKKSFSESYDILTIKMFSSDRSVIHEKILSRMMDMFDQGLINETKYLLEKYKLTSSCTMLFLHSGNTSRIAKTFREGKFEVKNYNLSCAKAEAILSLSKYYEGVRRKTFISAMLKCFKNKDFSFEMFESKLKRQSTTLVDCVNVDTTIELIEKIYNNRSRKKINLRF